MTEREVGMEGDRPGSTGIMTIEVPGGRALEVSIEDSDHAALVLVYHSGTPAGLGPFSVLSAAARASGLTLVRYSRPGYGLSSPQPGRSVVDATDDVAALLDSLGLGEFVSLGWSGGGPHALACGARLAPRCKAVALIAGVAPWDSDGLDWFNGMAPENIEEFGAAIESPARLTAFLDQAAGELATIKGEDIAEGLGELASANDVAAINGSPLGDELAAWMRRALLTGIDGWRDDDLAFGAPWGFDPAEVSVPVAIWQGVEDRMVPLAHGHWLDARIPRSSINVFPGDGHISVILRMDAIVKGLVELAGASAR